MPRRRRNQTESAPKTRAKPRASRARPFAFSDASSLSAAELSALRTQVAKLKEAAAVAAVTRKLIAVGVSAAQARPERHTGVVEEAADTKSGVERLPLRVYIWRNISIAGAGVEKIVVAGGPKYASKLALGSEINGGNAAGVYIQSLLYTSGRSGTAMGSLIDKSLKRRAAALERKAAAEKRREKRKAELAEGAAEDAAKRAKKAAKAGDARAAKTAQAQAARKQAEAAEAEANARQAAAAEREAAASRAMAEAAERDAEAGRMAEARRKQEQAQTKLASAEAKVDAPASVSTAPMSKRERLMQFMAIAEKGA